MSTINETKYSWGLSKCGEITTLLSVGKEEFFLSCDLCDFSAQDLAIFVHHVCERHLQEFVQIKLTPTSSELDFQEYDEENSVEGFENVVIDMDSGEMENTMDFKEEELSEQYIEPGNEDCQEPYQISSEAEVMTDNASCNKRRLQNDEVSSLGINDFNKEKKKNVEREKEITIEFINLYRTFPALWDMKHKHYHDQYIKREQYKMLLKKYKEMCPSAVLMDVKKFIYVLRTNYHKEFKRMLKTGLESTLYYYKALSFLHELPSDDRGKDLESMQISIGVVKEDTQSENVVETKEETGHIKHEQDGNSFVQNSDVINGEDINFTAEEKFIIEFIQLYQSCPSLWDINTNNYNDKEEKRIQYQILLQKFQERYPNAELKDVKKKINTLRTGYRRERQKVKSGCESKLYYYDSLRFLSKDESSSEVEPAENEILNEISFEVVKEDDMQLEEYQDTVNTFEDTEVNQSKFEENSYIQNDMADDVDVNNLNGEQNFILEFIELYKSLPALWNTNTKAYKDRKLKDSQYKILLDKYREMYPEADVNDVKNKINILRTNYRRELKRGPPYGLFYFQKLDFLRISGSNENTEISFEVVKEDDMQLEEDLDAINTFEVTEVNESKCEENSYVQNDMADDVDVNNLNDEQNFILEFIELYKSLPALWNTNTKAYKDRKLKDTQYNILLEKYQEMYPEADVNDVKNKINILRTNYRRELKRGPPYGLFYFQKLDFLRISGSNENTEHHYIEDEDDIESSLLEEYIESDSEFHSSPVEKKIKLIKTEKEFIIELIEVYRSLTALWDTKDKNYFNRIIKDKQWEVLLSKYKEMFPNADEGDIKRKIQCLRASYLRESKRMSQTGTDRSSLYFFDAISFIYNHETSTEPQSTTKTPSEMEENDCLFSVKVKSRLNQKQFIDLAKTYQEYPCLWNKIVPEYRFSNKRREAWNDLVEKYNKISNLNFMKNDLEKEISNLRKMCSKLKKEKLICKRKKKPYTPRLFNEFEFLMAHVSPFECTKCDKTINHYDKYKIHVASHDGSLPFECIICGHGFKYTNNLSVHLRRHMNDFIYNCNICHKTCATSTRLRYHMLTHTDERAHICDICGKSFKYIDHFKEHMRRHENRPMYKCQICSKPFYTRKSWKEHMAVHTKKRNVICDVCDKGFATRRRLLQHKSIHDAEKKFVCQICAKLFAQKSGLNSHMKTHGTSLSTIVTNLEQ